MTREAGYDRTWVDSVVPGRTRIRYGLTTRRGVPIRFLVQLEYLVSGEQNGADWRPVARFDHDATGPPYRNVDLVGLHMDIYGPDRTQRRKKTDFPPVELTQAMKRAEQFLKQDHDRLIRRYERWM